MASFRCKLEDPALDELLRELEQEIPISEVLGIPRRPSNLQIVSDWLRPGGDNSLTTGGNGGTMMNQMKQQQQMRQRQLDKAYRRAVARALKEATAEDLVKDMPQLARETADWNRLASQLEDELRQGASGTLPPRHRAVFPSSGRFATRVRDSSSHRTADRQLSC